MTECVGFSPASYGWLPGIEYNSSERIYKMNNFENF